MGVSAVGQILAAPVGLKIGSLDEWGDASTYANILTNNGLLPLSKSTQRSFTLRQDCK